MQYKMNNFLLNQMKLQRVHSTPLSPESPRVGFVVWDLGPLGGRHALG